MFSGSNNIDEVAWHKGNSGNQTHPVKQKMSNELGIYDMNGNVSEWCHNRYYRYGKYDPIYEGYDYDEHHRMIRGSGFNSQTYQCRIPWRDHYRKYDKSISRGFRLVLSE